MTSAQSIFLLRFSHVWILVACSNFDNDFEQEASGAECGLVHHDAQGSALLQMRRQSERFEMTQTFDRPQTLQHDAKNENSFTSFVAHGWSSVQKIWRSLSPHQKIMFGAMLVVITFSVLVWGILIRFGNQVLAAQREKKEREEEEERQRSRQQWEESVVAYRHAMQGKNSQTVIRGNKVPQPKESPMLQAALAQARARDGTVHVSEEKAREIRAQAALARLSNQSKDDCFASASAGPSDICSQAAVTPPIAENSRKQPKVGECSSLSSDFEADHDGPVACTYFRD